MMADIKNFGIVGVGATVQYGKGGGSLKWDTDGFVSTSDGVTLADLDAATVNFTGLKGTGAVTITNILDEDNMASDSATALATQQSIKAYVDAQTTGTTLSGTGDAASGFSVNLASGSFGVQGGTNITTTGSGSNVSIALDSDISLTSVTATGNVDASNMNITNDLVMGGGSGGAITGAATVSADSLVALNDLTVNGFLVDGIIDDDTMATASATTLATSESIKAYVDAAATAADLDFAGNSGTGAVDLDSQIFTIDGGLNLTSTASGQTLTVAMDTTLTGMTAATFSGQVSAGDFVVADGGALKNASGTASITMTAVGDIVVDVDTDFVINSSDDVTFSIDDKMTINTGNYIDLNAGDEVYIQSRSDKVEIHSANQVEGIQLMIDDSNITDPVVHVYGSNDGNNIGLFKINTSTPISAILDEDNMASDSDSAVPTQQSVKAYVDAQVTAADLDFQGDSGTGAVDLDSQALDIAGGTNLNTVASGQTLTVNMNADISVDSVTASGNVDALNVNVTDKIVMGGGSGGTISGASSLSADSLVALNDLTVNGFLVDGIIDDDTMATASATTLATSESVKAYVDATATAASLDIAGDSGTGSIDLDSQVFTIAGGIGLSSTTTGQTTEVRLNNTAVTAGTYGDATNIPQFTVDQQGRITAASNVAIQTSWTLTGDSGSEVVNGGDTVLVAGGTNITTVASATDTLTVSLDADISVDSVTATGNVNAGNVNVTDAIVMSGGSGGSITGADLVEAANITSTNTLTFNDLSDGTLTIDAILDEDNMVSDSDTAIPTQQSVKAYVDAEIAGAGVSMSIQGDTGSGSVIFATETLDIAGVTNETVTSYDAGTDTMSVGLATDVTIQGTLSTGGNLTVGGTLFSDDITANSIEIDGDVLVTGDTVMTGNLTVNGETTIINSNVVASGDAVITLNADLPSGQAPSLDMGLEMNRGSSANVHMLWKEGLDYFEFGDENSALQEVRASEFNAATFTGGVFNGTDATLTGDVSFGTLTDSGESISITKFVDEADGIANNDNDTTIPTSAAVIDYVTNNGGDGNLIRNGSVGTGATTVTIGTVPSVAGRTYYVEKVVIKVTVGFSGNSVDHIILNENGGLGTQIVAEADADILTGTYVVESDGATELTSGQTILLGFRDSGNNLVAPTAGACSVAVYYAWD